MCSPPACFDDELAPDRRWQTRRLSDTNRSHRRRRQAIAWPSHPCAPSSAGLSKALSSRSKHRAQPPAALLAIVSRLGWPVHQLADSAPKLNSLSSCLPSTQNRAIIPAGYLDVVQASTAPLRAVRTARSPAPPSDFASAPAETSPAASAGASPRASFAVGLHRPSALKRHGRVSPSISTAAQPASAPRTALR